MSQTIDLGKVVPMRGVDYYTDEDKEEILEDVLSEIEPTVERASEAADAAESGATAARNAASSANSAAGSALCAASEANSAAESANQASERADASADNADTAAARANEKAEHADDSAVNADRAAADANREMEAFAQEESVRASNETTRQSNEATRQVQETLRQNQEDARQERSDTDHDRAEEDHDNSVQTTVVAYASGSSNTIPPSVGWQETIPVVQSGNYLWTRTTFTLGDGTEVLSYGVSLIPTVTVTENTENGGVDIRLSGSLLTNGNVAKQSDLKSLVPADIKVTAPQILTIGNDEEKKVKVEMIPATAKKNVIFLSDGRAVDVLPDGQILIVGKGTGRVSVIPTGNTEMFKTVYIKVQIASIRMVSLHRSMRLLQGGNFRLY